MSKPGLKPGLQIYNTDRALRIWGHSSMRKVFFSAPPIIPLGTRQGDFKVLMKNQAKIDKAV